MRAEPISENFAWVQEERLDILNGEMGRIGPMALNSFNFYIGTLTRSKTVFIKTLAFQEEVSELVFPLW